MNESNRIESLSMSLPDLAWLARTVGFVPHLRRVLTSLVLSLS
jgi:hypothetical protein